MASPTQIGLSSHPARRQLSPMRFFAFSVAAGLLICLLAAFTFLRLPAAHAPTLTALSIRALAFVVIGALAGTAGSWYYWKNSASPFSANPPVPFTRIAFACAAGWVWVPAIVLFSREDSPFSVFAAIVAATLLAFALRKAIPSSAVPQARAAETERPQIFAATLRKPPRQYYGYILATCIYIAAYELIHSWILDASVMLAACAYIFIWKLTFAPADIPSNTVVKRRQSTRDLRPLAFAILPAFHVTLFALLHGIGHRNRIEVDALVNGKPNAGDSTDTAYAAVQPSANGNSGYQSIILWPAPEKKQILSPPPQPNALLAPGTTKPLIIRFDGPYFYFQAPNKRPSLAALQVHGTPLLHDFQSNNFMPLVMEAHQTLGTPIPIARCREIQVGILNSDNHPGPINIAALLSQTNSPSNQLYLGQQPVVSSQSSHFSFKSAPANETLRFPIPASATLRSFDHITVMFLPDFANYDTGAKVAIQQFQLIPR
jgi:hypothetical protein